MLNSEQKKLKDRKSAFNQLIKEQAATIEGRPGALMQLKIELTNLREAYNNLKTDVRSAVETELKQALKGQLKNADQYNYPR
jgi:chromosome segregation ATPase